MAEHIVLTGGGTAGHVTPNLALIESLQQSGWQISYIGSKNGVEEKMIKAVDVPFFAISSGKLRRYFSWQNFIDPLRIIFGIMQSFFLLRKLRANVVFSKGGFVAFPVVFAAWLQGIPVIAHESDLSPGLANRLSFPFVSKIAVNFAEVAHHFKNKDKIMVTGTPIRSQLFVGVRERGLALCHFSSEKPCLLIMGGSLGSVTLNEAIYSSLPQLTHRYQIIHLCGAGKIKKELQNYPGYYQLEYAHAELADIFAAADIVVSRSGANALFEILALQKPHILVPLSKKVSRGDQIQNANYFAKKGISIVIDDEAISPESLINALEKIEAEKPFIKEKIKQLGVQSATLTIMALIKEQLGVKSAEAL